MKPKSRLGRQLETASRRVTEWTGSSWAFALACLVIATWLVTGPLFHFSDTWQLVINTGTTIVTFLMVFLIQRTQNKDSLAVQLKLNEIVAAIQGASNRLIDVEDLSEQELRQLHRHYQALCTMAKRDTSLGQSHSIDEAETRHAHKRRLQAQPDTTSASESKDASASNDARDPHPSDKPVGPANTTNPKGTKPT